ncbi:MAG: hypothetical protein O7G85_10665 [Planctomycetota bacterium]|nr:hypothetical protein [Planctomycetota bacterium]
MLEKAIGQLAASLKDPKKFGGGQMLDRETGKKLAEAIAQRELEKQTKYLQKVQAEVEKDRNAMDKLNIDARMVALEGQMRVALSK